MSVGQQIKLAMEMQGISIKLKLSQSKEGKK